MSEAAESAVPDERTRELAARLADVRQRIDAARQAADRSDAVTLLAVTKTHPASDVARLIDLGVTDIGENRHPEARDKHDAVAGAHPHVRWHFVGGVQTNKAAAIARYADVVHSVDRERLVAGLSRGAESAGRSVECLVQIDFDLANPGRSGVAPEGVLDLAASIEAAPGLELGGVMTVAPLGVDPDPVFAHLQKISASIVERWPDASKISAGMTEDLEAAIRRGATHVRVGRALLGERPTNR